MSDADQTYKRVIAQCKTPEHQKNSKFVMQN
jgi:hypothetical protein